MGGLGSLPGLGRSPGEEKGYPLQCSGLENSTDCIVHGVTKSWTQLSDLHFHFHYGRVCMRAQLRMTLCDPMDYSPSGSCVHGILQARILEWVAMPSSRGSSRPRNRTPGLLHCRQILYSLSCRGRSVLNNFCPLLLHNRPAPCLLRKDGEAPRGLR